MEAQEFKLNNSDHMNKVIAKATEDAKAKNTRLRHMKERNENYLWCGGCRPAHGKVLHAGRL
jgi:hypothetical protein